MSKSQIRKYNKISIIKIFRFLYYKLIGVKFKGFCYIESGSKIMRFPKNITIGKNVILKSNSRICSCNENAKIFIGDNTTVGYNSLIFASKNIKISNDCLIAPNVHIVDSDHGNSINKKINMQVNLLKEICIEEDVWIGSGSIITKGVKLSKGSIVAAGAVQTQNTEEYEIWGGIPSKFIKKRN